MGLDILIYDTEHRLVSRVEITEGLHKEIFANRYHWKNYIHLRRLNDYYRANEEYVGESLQGLIKDLKQYKPLLAAESQEVLQDLVLAISSTEVAKVRINGD